MVSEEPVGISEMGSWEMKLWDGRRIVMPESMPIAPISANPFYALSTDLEGFETDSIIGDEDLVPMAEWTEPSPSEFPPALTNFEFEH
jgi:hypothetical protein